MSEAPEKRSGYVIAGIRSDGRCELCGLFSRRFHRHHRRPRAMGGSSRADTNDAQNILILCTHCHLVYVEVQREKAHLNGWLVYQMEDPAAVPVKLWDGWFYLAPDGARVPLIEKNRATAQGR